MARASTTTLLSLDRYAKLLGLAGPHFNGGDGGTVFPQKGHCTDIWPQYAWQSEEDLVSREELAQIIHTAEEDIKHAVGYALAPEWEDSEVHRYPHIYSHWASISTNWGKVIAPGRRALATIRLDAPVLYIDNDVDGWAELAIISVPTTQTNALGCKVYFADQEGDPEWEIRELKTKEISGGNLYITAPSWVFIKPSLWEAYPTAAAFAAIDISGTTNYVSTVDIYYEYIDTTQSAVEFMWEPAKQRYTYPVFTCTYCGGSGCTHCALTTQTGCLTVHDAETGIVTPFAATYSDATAAWANDTWLLCSPPDMVKMHYYAGNISDKYLAGRTFDPLSDYFAETIMWLATARLERPVCSCSNIQLRVDELRRDLTQSSRDRFFTRYEKMSMFDNPFGTRAGEVKAWDRIARLMGDQVWQGAAL